MKLSYAKLREHLESGKLQPVYVITGDQDLLRELATDDICHEALGGEATAFNFERLDGEDADGGRIAMAANTLPMLGGRRVVLVKRAQKPLEKSEELSEYLGSPAASNVLILELSKNPDKRRKTWKDTEKKACVVTCDTPRSLELDDWISDQAKARGLRLGRESVRYLAGEFGADLRRLLNELEKLSLYAGSEKLDLETISAVLGRGKAQSIFKFVDAVGAGKSAAALRQLGRLMEEGEPPLRILALLDRLIGQLRVTREMQRAGKRSRGDKSLSQVLGVPPYAAKSLSEAARRFDGTSLDDAVASLAETDLTLKSSGVSARLVLERLVLSLCSSGGTGRIRVGI